MYTSTHAYKGRISCGCINFHRQVGLVADTYTKTNIIYKYKLTRTVHISPRCTSISALYTWTNTNRIKYKIKYLGTGTNGRVVQRFVWILLNLWVALQESWWISGRLVKNYTLTAGFDLDKGIIIIHIRFSSYTGWNGNVWRNDT